MKDGGRGISPWGKGAGEFPPSVPANAAGWRLRLAACLGLLLALAPMGHTQPLAPPPPPPGSEGNAEAALLLSPAERRDRAEINLRDQRGLSQWRWFNATAVDWAGWRLHPGGVRITLVKPAVADVGLTTSAATAIAVQCESLRQTWRIDGSWAPWRIPASGSVAQRIVLDLCSNTLDGPAVPVIPVP